MKRIVNCTAAAAALSVAMVLGACTSGERDGLNLGDPTATSSTADSTVGADPAPSSAVPSASVQPSAAVVSAEEQAVLDAYRAFWAALDQAQADPPRSQDYLAPVATGAQFEQTNSAIKADFLAGEESVGSPLLAPRVASIDGDIAVVHDCQDTREAVRRDVETGEVLLVGMAEDSVESTLKRVDGTWKVAGTTYPEPAGVFC
ncbi:hypothetical protein [Aquipuribacter hungaricus]|uniref:DUF3828 domain-containing protein n=1 Tax=Aquipuribacter hungaricus TaxID=545624 RepID=A0ABV7WIB3_9MICO